MLYNNISKGVCISRILLTVFHDVIKKKLLLIVYGIYYMFRGIVHVLLL